MNKEQHKEYYENLETCPICLSKIGKRHIYKTDCNHKFHLKCLFIWLLKNDNCPMCRTNVRTPDIIEQQITPEERDRIESFVNDFFFLSKCRRSSFHSTNWRFSNFVNLYYINLFYITNSIITIIKELKNNIFSFREVVWTNNKNISLY